MPALLRTFLRTLLLASTLVLLAACGPVKHPINPPGASIQQLDVLPDGHWRLQVRLENFSDQTVRYGTFKAELRVGGEAAGEVWGRIMAPRTISNLPFSEYALKKAVAVTLQHLGDARDVGRVQSQSDDLHDWPSA